MIGVIVGGTITTLIGDKKMKIATLPKSGTHLFRNIIKYLGAEIQIDHVVMPNRAPFIDDVTPTIVTSRDPRGYFLSLLNWYDRIAGDLASGVMSRDASYQYFDPKKADKWVKLTTEERLRALVDDSPESLMVVKSRDSYDAVMKSRSKSNCYVTSFDTFAPVKDSSRLCRKTISEYDRMLSHLGIEMNASHIRKMLEASWGHSITYSPSKVDDWKLHIPQPIQDRIVELYRDVFDEFDYPIKARPRLFRHPIGKLITALRRH